MKAEHIDHTDLQAKLKELFHYDPETGLFVRKVSRGNTKAGDVAGSKDNKGYLRVLFNGKREKLHRLAFLYMEGRFPSGQVDHKNGVKDDNRWENLREVSNEENASNRTKSNTNNQLGVLGVYRFGDKYRAMFKGKHLGLFETIDEAAAAYQRARSEYESRVYRPHGQ